MIPKKQDYESINRPALGLVGGAALEDHQKDNNNNNNNNIFHVPGRVLSDEDKNAILEAYVDNIGDMTGAVAGVIERAFAAGIDAADIIMAIEDTGLAPRPSGLYLKRILDRWIETGVTVSRARDAVHSNNSTKWWRRG